MKIKIFLMTGKFLILLSLLSILLLSCGNTTINSAANGYSPLAPEIVAGSQSGRNISRLVSSDDQEFGSFGMIQASALNYNSMIEGTVPHGVSMIESIGSFESEVSYGPLVRKVENGLYAFFENEDATITSFLEGSEVQSRQFDAYILDDNVKYSRCYFYWPTNLFSYRGVDITEVWEYPNRKEVSVTLFNRDDGTVGKYLAVTDTSDELQRTSLLYAHYTVGSGAFTLDNYDKIGCIDFDTITALEAEYVQRDTFIPAEYPNVSFLDDLHNKSFDLNNIEDVIIDYTDLIPYISFLEQ